MGQQKKSDTVGELAKGTENGSEAKTK